MCLSGQSIQHVVLTARSRSQEHVRCVSKGLCTPCYLNRPVVAQAWLQEFAWTEAEKLQKWKKRAGNLRLTSAALHDLNKEPMFCFESAIKLYYYSHIIYQYHKVVPFPLGGMPSAAAEDATNYIQHLYDG